MIAKLALSLIGRTAALAAAIGAGIALAQEPSTFQKTCNQIRYGVDAAGTPVVVASCPKSDNNKRVESYAALRGFHNKEGRLSAGPGAATFHKTCTGMKVGVRKDDGAVVLSASCPKTSGEQVETSIVLWDVHADSDGRLHHRRPGNDKVTPPVK
jgi:hypothetical protein